MKKESVLIIGSGHLAYRVKKLVNSHNYQVIYLPNRSLQAKDQKESAFETTIRTLKNLNLGSVRMAYVIDDIDAYNLELIIGLVSIKKDLPIVAALSNENIAPHLRAANPNIQIINPAKIAAPEFVEALYKPITHALKYTPTKIAHSHKKELDVLIWVLGVLFAILIAGSIIYFHIYENLSWLDSIYFVVVTIATVGYGDIALIHSPSLSKIVDIVLILASTFFIWTIFSLTVDRIIKHRVQLALGRKRYAYRDHVIICGLGRLGYFIAEGLLEKGEKLIIVEKNEDAPAIEYFRSRGVSVYIGDARLPRVLQDIAVCHAKALYSVINNDYTNLEVGLNARTFEPKLKIILRIFDKAMSQKIKNNLDIQLNYSMSAIADEYFYNILKNKKSA